MTNTNLDGLKAEVEVAEELFNQALRHEQSARIERKDREAALFWARRALDEALLKAQPTRTEIYEK